MFQATINDLKRLLKDKTLFVEKTVLNVDYSKIPDSRGVTGTYSIVTNGVVLLHGKYSGLKATVNSRIADDVVINLMSRGHFLMYHSIQPPAPADGPAKDKDQPSNEG